MTNPTLTDSNFNLISQLDLTTRFFHATNEVAWKVAPGTYYYNNFPLLGGTDTDGNPVIERKSGHITVERTSYVFTSFTEPGAEPTVMVCETTLANELKAEQQKKAAARAARFELFMEKHAVRLG